ncbi:CdiA C-terminal domain-containing protein [Kitasatospora griseola]|uniref:CdiA C-terminal domain-containing protein n=1 Tax=Kitasatospora griseola TaxID=2064 RepID=UPI00380231AD
MGGSLIGGGLVFMRDGIGKFDQGLRTALREAEAGNPGGGGSAAARTSNRTSASGTPDPNAAPSGRVTKIDPKDDVATARSKQRENETAQNFAKQGYKVEQNPDPSKFTAEDNITPGKKPDYRIEGEIFDCYSPSSDNPWSIWSNAKGKVDAGQAYRLVLNTSDTPVQPAQLAQQFKQNPITNLKEVMIDDGKGNIIRIYP